MSMERKLVMGNEAIALGAVRAGVRMVAGIRGRRRQRFWRQLQSIMTGAFTWSGLPMRRPLWKSVQELLMPAPERWLR